MNRELIKKTRELETKTNLLKRLRYIRNELLSNGAYHEKNLEQQIDQLEKVNAPRNEINLIQKSNDIISIYVKELFKEYENIINLMSGEHEKEQKSN